MKKIVPLLLCFTLLTLTGCPPSSEPVAPGTSGGAAEDPAAASGKSQEVLDRIANHKAQWGVTPEKNAQYKPKLLATLTGKMTQPDGMTVNPVTKTIFLNCPNFNFRENDEGPKNFPGVLVRVKLQADDTAILEELLVYEEKAPFPETGQVGPMGLYFGPDGHLYVCDNQYFFNDDWKSRILRVRMDGDNPTGEVEVVVEGMKLANAILWAGDRMLVTDTFLDIDVSEGYNGSGCLWMFSKEEILAAGSEGNPPIRLNPVKQLGNDPHCIAIHLVKELPGAGNGGLDGLTVDSNGIFYYGNFGNGEMYRLIFDEEGNAVTDTFHEAGDYFSCCDGIFYDADTNKIYINDSAANAIHAFVPPAWGEKAVFETLWENGDTDGADGSLDQPAELVVVDGKMVIANFDWPFPELLNTKSEKPGTLSLINLK